MHFLQSCHRRGLARASVILARGFKLGVDMDRMVSEAIRLERKEDSVAFLKAQAN